MQWMQNDIPNFEMTRQDIPKRDKSISWAINDRWMNCYTGNEIGPTHFGSNLLGIFSVLDYLNSFFKSNSN